VSLLAEAWAEWSGEIAEVPRCRGCGTRKIQSLTGTAWLCPVLTCATGDAEASRSLEGNRRTTR
jgi:hypothetical protein